MHIAELHHELLRQGGSSNSNKQRIIPYVASARFGHDVIALARVGWNVLDIAQVLNVSSSSVQRQIAKKREQDAARSKFLKSGRLPSYDEPGLPSGIFTIYQS